jgi:hypothetical protein
MVKQVNPETLIKALAESGYFIRGSYNPDHFCSVVENKLGIGRARALAALEESGLTKFEYDPSPSIHPREKVDYWRVVLTEKGAKLVERSL